MILLDSLYINDKGGGKILLDYIIKKFEEEKLPIFYLLDARVTYDQLPDDRKLYLKSSSYNRFLFYKKNASKFSIIFCFANLAPPIKLTVPVYTYFHQSMYVNGPLYLNRSFKIKFFFKKLFFKYLLKNTHYLVVQTSLIQSSLVEKFNFPISKILVLPIYDEPLYHQNVVREKNTFLYVSSGSPHKNHLRLLKAFCKFYDLYQTGKLFLTVDKSSFPILINEIDLIIKCGYPIVNIGHVNRDELFPYYYKSEYLIYPSLEESFGLGLLEAIDCGYQVIGADLPYTHEVCSPSYLFDPFSVESIFRALELSFLGGHQQSQKKIHNSLNSLIQFFKI